jgi:hypothetical protein
VGGEGGDGIGKGGGGKKWGEMTQTLYAHMNKRKTRINWNDFIYIYIFPEYLFYIRNF